MKLFIKLFLTCLFSIATTANATDTYNHVNNQLTIPAVVLGDTVYKDVVITVGPVLTVGGSNLDPKYPAKPSTAIDSYDPYKNQLTIPSVNAYGFVYYDVVVNVGTVLAVGSSSPVTPPMPAKINMASINSVIFSELNLSNPQNDDLMHDIIAIGDVNGDGYDDILVGVMRLQAGTWNSVNRTVKPILLMYNPTLNIYEVSQTFKSVVSNHIYPRQASIADFDGDGRNDIFIGDAGVDGGSYDCGAQNSLILNKKSGMVNASNLLPKVNDYSHGIITADFNLDGKPDLFVLNSPWINRNVCNVPGVTYRNRSYLLSGTTFNELALTTFGDDAIQLGLTEQSSNDPLLIAEAADLNKDGHLDLVFVGNYGVTIAESTGNMTYGKIQKIPPPASYYSKFDNTKCLILSQFSSKCMTPYSYISFYDIDGDGQPEIIASLLNQGRDNGWLGQYFQVLKRVNGVWTDVTDSVFPDQSGSQSNGGEWCYRVQLADFNNDGKLDLLCSGYKSTIWTFNKGQFVKTQTINTRANVVKFPGASYLIEFYVTPNSMSISGNKL
jgi:hypothetical protein